MAILDIIRDSNSAFTASNRVCSYLLRREMQQTEKSMADTFTFAVTACEGTMNAEQISRYQSIWEQYGDLMREIKVGGN